MNKFNFCLDDFTELNDEQIDELSLGELHQLQEELDIRKIDLKDIDRELTAAILRRCEAQARAELFGSGKNTGTITLHGDDNFNYKFELPKKVEWNQAKLRAAVEGLAKQGKNVDQYVTIKISVPEANYNAWPDEIKACFIDARTVESGAPKAEVVPAKQVKSRNK